MKTMLRRIVKIAIFIITLVIVGRLSSPYFYDIVSLKTADKISALINDSSSAEDIDNVYFYLNFLLTMTLTIPLYLFLTKAFSTICKQRHLDKKMRP
ncbi:hypothetical protein IBT47_02760 [Erwinia sp. S43]|uniref:hypothetical protein n=1 Tax=Erwinia sp. S43 TaxID=2769339 RepID=UPI00190B8F8B|nr:hypothetical protein [Erwinia sp. S43]MBK0031195.1 hypothetical protein [Erwinia sp. S43]